MLTYLVVVSTAAEPLDATAIAHLSAPPIEAMTHDPEQSLVWLADDRLVGVAAWQTRAEAVGGSHWHVGAHGLTLFGGVPWRLDGRWSPHTGWAPQITAELDAAGGPTALDRWGGSHSVARFRRDGSSWVAPDATGAGPVYVARHPRVVAISNRAGVAAAVVGAARDPEVAASLTSLGVQVGGSGYRDVVRVGRGEVLRSAPGRGVEVVSHDRWAPGGAADDVAPVDDVAGALLRQVQTAASHGVGDRWLHLRPGPGALLLLAAVAATGTGDRFRAVCVGEPTALAPAAALAGVELDGAPAATGDDVATADAWVRRTLHRTEGTVSVDRLLDVPERDGLVVTDRFGDLWATTTDEPAPSDLLSETGRLAIAPTLARLRDHHGRHAPRRVLSDHLLPAVAAAASDLIGPALVVAPLQNGPALSAASPERLRDLVTALHPPMTRLVDELGGASTHPSSDALWPQLGPVAEAALTVGSDDAANALDPAALERRIRSATPPDDRSALWGAVTAVGWLRGDEMRHAVGRHVPRMAVPVAAPSSAPILVTGLTSRSILDLAGIRVPLDETAIDPVLGIRVDLAAADLVDRILLRCDAGPTAIPPDLATRLAGPDTASFAEPARALLARRGGILTDPRLGVTLPFWRAHVAEPEVVLVTERPLDLVERLGSTLPTDVVVGLWLDVVAAAVIDHPAPRVLDPGDIADTPIGEGGSARPRDEDLTGSDLVHLATVIDSLVRELEVDAARPLLRLVRDARTPQEARPADAGVRPAVAIATVWQETSALRAEVAELAEAAADAGRRADAAESTLARLRSRRTVRLLERLLRDR